MSFESQNDDADRIVFNPQETVFTHPDYSNFVSRPTDIIAKKRRVIKDNIQPRALPAEGVERFDFSKDIKNLEKDKNIYFTNGNGDIVAYLIDQPRHVAEKIYGEIGKTICAEYLKDPSVDFKDKMRELSLHLYEIELRSQDNFVIGIKLGLDNKPMDDDENDAENDADKETSLPN